VAPEEETRCTETDGDDDGRSATLGDELIGDLIHKLEEAGVSDAGRGRCISRTLI